MAIFGIVPKEEIIYSNTAQVGDDILIAVDLDGKFHEKFHYAWDTTSHKSPELVQSTCRIMRTIAEKKMVHAAKDISNPGMAGTLGMLLDASGKGGFLNVTQVPKKKEAPLQQWLCMYPGFGMVLTCNPSNSKQLVQLFKRNKIAATVCGEVEENHELYLTDGVEKAMVLNFKKNFISGTPR